MLSDPVFAQGRYFVKDFVSAARAGGDFVAYEWPRPGGGEAAAKIAYVMPFKPWNWVIGSGLYIDDLETAALEQISVGGILIFILFVIDIAVSLHISKRYIYELRDTAIHDGLTGLFTRRYLDEVGERMIARSEIEGSERLAAIFFDLDHFKRVNDTYGHKTGDIVLSTVGRILKKHLRPNELAFRYGGEEMVILLNATENNCRIIAERIRAAVQDHEFMIAGNRFKITLSAGAAIAQHNEALADLLRRADACLYAAKELGRNQTVTESETGFVANQVKGA